MLSRVFCKTVRATLKAWLESTVICRTLKLSQWKFGLLPKTGVFASLTAADPVETAQRNSSSSTAVGLNNPQLLSLLLLGLGDVVGPWGRAVLKPGVAEAPLTDRPEDKSANQLREWWSSTRPKKNICGSSRRGAVALQQMQADQCLSVQPLQWFGV